MVKARDRRFTVSVAADIAERLDYRVRTNANANRSALVEEALRVWETLAEYPDKQKTLNQALELYEKEQEREIYRSYYSELSESAKAEDDAWSELSAESAERIWPTDRAPSKRRAKKI